jgi:Arc/MetJ-type ribon-helix-helix transcriptional regulator
MKSKVKKDVKITLRVSKGMRSELDNLTKRNNTNMSEIIRYAFNELINSKSIK